MEQDLVRLLEGRIGRQTGQLRHLAQEGYRGHLSDEGVVLGHVSDSRPRLAHVAPAVDAQDTGPSGAGAVKSEQREDQRGLARPVGSQEPDRFACAGHAETAGDPVKDLPPSQFHFQVFELYDRCGIQASIAVLLSPCPGSRSASRP